MSASGATSSTAARERSYRSSLSAEPEGSPDASKSGFFGRLFRKGSKEKNEDPGSKKSSKENNWGQGGGADDGSYNAGRAGGGSAAAQPNLVGHGLYASDSEQPAKSSFDFRKPPGFNEVPRPAAGRPPPAPSAAKPPAGPQGDVEAKARRQWESKVSRPPGGGGFNNPGGVPSMPRGGRPGSAGSEDDGLIAQDVASARPICVAWREGRCEFGAWCFWSHGNDGVTSMPGMDGRRNSFDPVFVPPPSRDPYNRPVVPDLARRASLDLKPPPASSKEKAGGEQGDSAAAAGAAGASKAKQGGFLGMLKKWIFPGAKKTAAAPGRVSLREYASDKDKDKENKPPLGKGAGPLDNSQTPSSSSGNNAPGDPNKPKRVNAYDLMGGGGGAGSSSGDKENVAPAEGDALREYMRQRENFNNAMMHTLKAAPDDMSGDLFADAFVDVDAASSSSDTGGTNKPPRSNIYDDVKVEKENLRSNVYDTGGAAAPGPRASSAGGFAFAGGPANKEEYNSFQKEGIEKPQFKTFNPTVNTKMGAGPDLGPPPAGPTPSPKPAEKAAPSNVYDSVDPSSWAQNARTEARESKVYNKVHPQPAPEEPSYRNKGAGAASGAEEREYATSESKQEKNYYSRLGARMGGRASTAGDIGGAGGSAGAGAAPAGPGPTMKEPGASGGSKSYADLPGGPSLRGKADKAREAEERAAAAARAEEARHASRNRPSPRPDEKAEKEKAEREKAEKEKAEKEKQQQAAGSRRNRGSTSASAQNKDKEKGDPRSGYFWYEGYYYYFDAKYNVYWWWDEVAQKYHQCVSEEEQRKHRQQKQQAAGGGPSGTSSQAPPGFGWDKRAAGGSKSKAGSASSSTSAGGGASSGYPSSSEQQGAGAGPQQQQSQNQGKPSSGGQQQQQQQDNQQKQAPPDMSRTAANFMSSADDASEEQIRVNKLIMQLISDLQSHENEPVADRKKVFRKLCLEWHPDKHSSDAQFVAKCAFQFLQEKKEWFLKE